MLALGTLGYIGYRYFRSHAGSGDRGAAIGEEAVAGGPLSENASVQSDPAVPPITDPYSGPHAPIPAG
jgi:hypothetical protein